MPVIDLTMDLLGEMMVEQLLSVESRTPHCAMVLVMTIQMQSRGYCQTLTLIKLS